MIKKVVLLFISALLLVSCSIERKTYRIGMDPSWYPLNLQGKAANVYAFANELLVEIGKEEGILFEKVSMSWDNLILGLKEKKYEGMLSSMTPRTSLETTYAFSSPFLDTGPVLVVEAGAKISSPSQLKGKEIAVDSLQNESLLIEHFPGVIVQYYTQIPEGLNHILSGELNGALVNYLQAVSYIQDLYYGKIKIATAPLNDAGLRLISLKGDETALIERFNRGLETLRDNGILDKLLKKWNLTTP